MENVFWVIWDFINGIRWEVSVLLVAFTNYLIKPCVSDKHKKRAIPVCVLVVSVLIMIVIAPESFTIGMIVLGWWLLWAFTTLNYKGANTKKSESDWEPAKDPMQDDTDIWEDDPIWSDQDFWDDDPIGDDDLSRNNIKGWGKSQL